MIMSKVGLLIIYNHRYDKNISRLEEVYKGRFSNLFHIVPFYNGKQENVISVYESSYFFSGYVSQAYEHLKDKGFTHFFVVADDMIINPDLNENNLWLQMGIDADDCYMDELMVLQEQKIFWSHLLQAMDYVVAKEGVEISNILPSRKEAKECFDRYDIPYIPIPKSLFIGWIWQQKEWKMRKRIWRYIKKRRLDYPLVGGYSDICLVTADVMEKFALYCGAFAATDLFVELAIPTSMVLSTKKLKVNKDIKLDSGAMWSEEDMEFLQEYNFNLAKLIEHFPANKLYLHPIKLSKWK
ncbi:hypothetical protein [Bacteroides xylanisolvens]|uniref:hypothetical protein n=1 Tax=Bacteroides xylanisolvens TaxID=371601 RepID=UPI001899CEE1|nr:hypothetical protein [Bacteroides xylanisolvens]